MSRNQTRKCADCGKQITGFSQRCDPCKTIHNKIQNRASARRWNEQHRNEYQRNYSKLEPVEIAPHPNFEESIWLSRRLVITRDPRPVEQGGFSKGSRFSEIEMKAMLLFNAQGEAVLLDGTQIRNTKSGTDYIVKNSKLWECKK